MDFLENLNLNTHYIIILFVNLAITFGLLTMVKFISAAISNINAFNELAEKDNPAFGVSLGALALSVTLIMTGVITGEAHISVVDEALIVLKYGLLGLLLMTCTCFIFDRISMPKICIKSEILKGNIAIAITDAGNMIASALIIRNALIWIENYTFHDMLLVIGIYLISQVLLTLATKYRMMIFTSKKDETLQSTLQDGNQAAAWLFSGYRIGVALAISAASALVPYHTETLLESTAMWMIFSCIIAIFITVMVWIADKIILYKINVRDEVNNQRNSAIGIVQAVIIISVSLVIATLTS